MDKMKWELIPLGNNIYNIRNLADNRILNSDYKSITGVKGVDTEDMSNTGAGDKQWKLTLNNDGSYTIKNVGHAKRILDSDNHGVDTEDDRNTGEADKKWIIGVISGTL